MVTFEYIKCVLTSGVKSVPAGSLWFVRWERLWDDLSGLADDHEKLEREELAGQVRDEQWADTSWEQLLTAATEIEVAGAGRLSGRVDAIGTHMFGVTTQPREYLVSLAAVRSLNTAAGHSRQPPVCRHRQVLREWARSMDEVQLIDVEGYRRRGMIRRVGKDFLLVDTPPGTLAVPLSGLAAISRSR